MKKLVKYKYFVSTDFGETLYELPYSEKYDYIEEQEIASKIIYKKFKFEELWDDIVLNSSELSDVKNYFEIGRTLFGNKPRISIKVFDEDSYYSYLYVTEKHFKGFYILRGCREYNPCITRVAKEVPADIFCEYIKDKGLNFAMNVK